MSAVGAVAHATDLVQICVVGTNGGPLPRVFTTVSEEDVGARTSKSQIRVESTLVISSSVHLRQRQLSHVESIKHSLTHVRPVGHIQKG